MTLRWKKTSINWKSLRQKKATKTGKNNQTKKHTQENNYKPNKTKPEHQKKRLKLEKPRLHGTLLFHNQTINHYTTNIKKQVKTIQEYEIR